jgi:hypothetical protein
VYLQAHTRRRGQIANLLRLLHLLQSLDFATLLLKLLLLLLKLHLGLLVGDFLVLQLVADCKAGDTAERAADCGSRRRASGCSADYGARTGTERGAAEGAFLAGGQRLAGASGKGQKTNHQES